MSKMSEGGLGRQFAALSCVVGTMLAVACVWPLPGVRAADPVNPAVLQEPAEEKPADKDPPPAQKVTEEPEQAAEAPADAPGFLQRLLRGMIFGPSSDENNASKKRKQHVSKSVVHIFGFATIVYCYVFWQIELFD